MRLIDADALIPKMRTATIDSEIGMFPILIGFNAIVKVIEEQPTIEPQRMRGKWIDADLDKDFWTCSECKKSGRRDRMAWKPDYVKTHFRFCPNCGADMRGTE